MSRADSVPKPPAVFVFGDSHSVAVSRAVRKRLEEGRLTSVKVFRPIKRKAGKIIGDIHFDEFLGRISGLDSNDVVVSMIGGSQYAILGTAQHPRTFDFYAPGKDPSGRPGSEIIPYRALLSFVAKCITKDVMIESGGVIRGDGQRLEALRRATRAQVVHVVPPPPIHDNDAIARRHENWLGEGINRFGVASPEIRLKFWSMQTRMLQKLCEKHDIAVIMPPPEAIQDGFLRPEFHQGGAHANALYGELVLRALETRYLRDGQTRP